MAADALAQATTETVEVPVPPAGGEGVLVAPEAIPAEGHSLFPPFDATAFPSHLFWLAISFGVLYYVTQQLIVPRVGGILEDRRDRIAGDFSEASRLRQETDDVIATYEAELAEARQRAHAIAQQRRDELKRELDGRRAETEAELQAKIAAAEETIAGLRNQALGEIEAIASGAAEAIIERIGRVTADGAEIRAAVDEAKGATRGA